MGVHREDRVQGENSSSKKLGEEGEREEESELVHVEGVDTRDKFQGQNNSSTIEAVEGEVSVHVDTLAQGIDWEVKTVGEKGSSREGIEIDKGGDVLDGHMLVPVRVHV